MLRVVILRAARTTPTAHAHHDAEMMLTVLELILELILELMMWWLVIGWGPTATHSHHSRTASRHHPSMNSASMHWAVTSTAAHHCRRR